MTRLPRSIRRVHRKTTPARLAALSAAVLAGAVFAAAPAQADPTSDAFIDAVTNAGLGVGSQTDPVALGQSVCPMLAEPGQTAADAASSVADAAGMGLGPATMFTGLAISAFCPGAMSALGNGESPIPFGLFGF